MNRKHLSKIKTLLVGFVLAKIVVTVISLVGLVPLTDLLFTQETAVAQDAVVEAETGASFEGEPGAVNENQTAEMLAVMNQLEVKRLQLKDEETRLKQERAQLEKIKRDIDLKLEELTAVQAKIDEGLSQKAQMATQEQQQQSAAEDAKMKQLVKVYTSMNPKKAAEIIDKLDMNVVHEVFSNMKGEQVGQILTYVSGERAAEITERLAAKN